MTGVAGPDSRGPARALAAGNAWRASTPDGGTVVIRTAKGREVWIGQVRRRGSAVDIWLAGNADDAYRRDPDFTIENPPTLIEDPNGDIEIRGRRWAADPIRAIAEVLVSFGAARGERRRPR